MAWEQPAGATRLVLVRHGETDAAPGRICGRLDPVLSAAGRARMEAVARWLAPAPLAAVVASTARRALASAEVVAAPHGLAVEPIAGLRELDFGALEGLSWEEARARHPETCDVWLARPAEVRFPRGEGWSDLRERVSVALAELRRRHASGTVAAVAHAGVIRAALATALRLDGDAPFGVDQSHGGVTVIDWFGADAFVRLVNGGPAASP